MVSSDGDERRDPRCLADPQLDGMERLCGAIGELLLTGAAFENDYSLVIAAGNVQCATRFNEPPEESEFPAVFEEFSRKHVGV